MNSKVTIHVRLTRHDIPSATKVPDLNYHNVRLAQHDMPSATEVAALIVNDTIGNRKGWISLFSKRPLGREEYQRTFIIHGYAVSIIIPLQRRYRGNIHYILR